MPYVSNQKFKELEEELAKLRKESADFKKLGVSSAKYNDLVVKTREVESRISSLKHELIDAQADLAKFKLNHKNLVSKLEGAEAAASSMHKNIQTYIKMTRWAKIKLAFSSKEDLILFFA